MDVKLSSSSPSPSLSPSGKQFDFCDDLSEHGYGSLEDLNCPTSTSNVSPMVQGFDVSSSSLPTAATTTTITSSSSSPSSSSSSSPLSSASSIDSIASLNNSSSSSSKKSTESTEQASTSSPVNIDCKVSHQNDKPTGDQNRDKNNNKPTYVNSSTILDNSVGNSFKESNHRCKENLSGESRNDQKINDGKVQSPSTQMLQSGNRFRFVPKNRQTNPNDSKCRNGGTFQSNGRNNNRGSRKGTRSESDYGDNRKRSQMRNKNNEDIVFIIRRVDRSLRRTVSESSGETQPVRGILKYPRDWNRRTQSESNCDNSGQSNLMDSRENGQTQSLECISPLEASCEASTESACSSVGEQSPGHDEEKPKKSVHFNCYVSKATFNINSTILNNNNKHSGSNKKKNRKHNSNNPSSTNNDHKNTNSSKQNTNNNKINKDRHPNNHPNQNSWKSQLHQQNLPESNNNQTDTTKTLTDHQKSVNCDENKIVTDSVIILNGDKEDQSENIDPMEIKFRSRQDSGYDSETSDRRGFIEDSGKTTTCVKSPNRQFTVQKVDLN